MKFSLMKPSIRKTDILLILALLALSVCLRAAGLSSRGTSASQVTISVDGQREATLDLSRDAEYTVSGYGGGVNHVVIQDGEVWVDEASCPDKLCVRQGRVRDSGQMIICLPNRVVVEITGEE